MNYSLKYLLTYSGARVLPRRAALCWLVLGAAFLTSAAPMTAQGLGRLTVQPQTMATGTQTAQAGLFALDSLSPGDSLLQGAALYVPKRAVGKQRVPVLVFLHGSGMNGREMIEWDDKIFEKFADSAGVILLAPTSHSSDGGWGDLRDTAPPNVDVPRLDAALRFVLKQYAIDPKRIALLGASAGAGAALDLGYVNGDIFHQVIVFSGFQPFLGVHEFDAFKPHGTPAPAFYIGINSGEGAALGMPAFVEWFRKAGYGVTYAEDSGPHPVPKERTNPGLAWLVQNWR